jgi:hypothetical protein
MYFQKLRLCFYCIDGSWCCFTANVLSNGKSSVGLVSTTGTTDRRDLAAGL